MNRLTDRSEICALDFKKGIWTIRDLLGFGGYWYRLVDCQILSGEPVRLEKRPSAIVHCAPNPWLNRLRFAERMIDIVDERKLTCCMGERFELS
jgi:hypothetical protein